MPGKLFTGIVSESGAKHTRGLAKAGESVRWLGLVGFVLQLIPQNLQRGKPSLQGFRGQVGGKRLWQALYGRSWTQRLKVRESSEIVLSFYFEDAQAFEVTGSCIHYHMIHLWNKIWPTWLCQSKCLNPGRSRLITVYNLLIVLGLPVQILRCPLLGCEFCHLFFMLAARYEWQGAIAKDALRICLCRIWWRRSWRQRHFAMRKSCYLNLRPLHGEWKDGQSYTFVGQLRKLSDIWHVVAYIHPQRCICHDEDAEAGGICAESWI